MLRRVLTWLLVLLLLAVAVGTWQRGPRLLWEATTDERRLDVLVVDKTVANASYREHAGLTFLLNHWRVTGPASDPIDPARDYVGVRPDGDGGVEEVPIEPEAGSADLVYVADTYGVYEDDLGNDRPTGARSELVFGGITTDEVDALEQALRPGGTLVAEFNTFASPTREDARAALGDLVGVRWTGWIGRHFADLDADDPELPAWLVPAWEAQEDEEWDYDGPGYALVHEDGRVVVLREGEDTSRPGVQLVVDGRREWITYDYWFDVVEALDGAEVLGTWELRVREGGADLLDEAGIPASIPAVVRLDGDDHVGWYFAGDFADLDPLPERYDRRGIVDAELARAPEDARDDQRRFFWGTYAPLLDEVVDGAVAARRRR